ncbi:diguanylate cyclase [Dyella solisilvae]|uniref:Diguanylate cyclase n=1 Tax=Dyella solisilvae TaxID=1920168 RepID=A0A370K5H8_9GAMM|nr:diguanylate cyclase [Dyella solisilvae]RDI97888.1 diguanylate cyclase [Dyella solisilvae]
MGVRGLDHINLRAPATLIERLRRFYIDVIGLSEGPRPAVRSRGHWLYAGAHPLVHLTIADEGDGAAMPTGWIAHYAMACNDLTGMRARLDQARVPYRVGGSPEQVQLFLLDPAGVTLELNFKDS